MNIFHYFDGILYFIIGIYLIVLSIKKKEKFSDKAVFVRFGGIMMVLLAIFSLFR